MLMCLQVSNIADEESTTAPRLLAGGRYLNNCLY